MNITATHLNKHSGKYITQSQREPIIIEKSGHPVAVIVSYDHYVKMEDAYWGEKAILSEQEQSIGAKESMEFLKSDN